MISFSFHSHFSIFLIFSYNSISASFAFHGVGWEELGLFWRVFGVVLRRHLVGFKEEEKVCFILCKNRLFSLGVHCGLADFNGTNFQPKTF
jgi:hypothetical protein